MTVAASPRAIGVAALALVLDSAREAAAEVLRTLEEGFVAAEDLELLGLATLAARLARVAPDPVIERASRALSERGPARRAHGARR